MTDQFKDLSQNEWSTLQNAVPLIAILIAGADGVVGDTEVSWSKKVTHIRSYKLKGSLQVFYEEADRDFEAKFMHFIETLPSGVKDRTDAITKKLHEVNPILCKLDTAIGSKLYNSFVTFAEQVAKAEGGVMGFFSINKDEAKLLGLPMIDPIHHTPNEEEE